MTPATSSPSPTSASQQRNTATSSVADECVSTAGTRNQAPTVRNSEKCGNSRLLINDTGLPLPLEDVIGNVWNCETWYFLWNSFVFHIIVTTVLSIIKKVIYVIFHKERENRNSSINLEDCRCLSAASAHRLCQRGTTHGIFGVRRSTCAVPTVPPQRCRMGPTHRTCVVSRYCARWMTSAPFAFGTSTHLSSSSGPFFSFFFFSVMLLQLTNWIKITLPLKFPWKPRPNAVPTRFNSHLFVVFFLRKF